MLTLDQNPIYDAGVQQLADALLINKTLTALSLNRTDIGAASARSLADVLTVNRMPDTRFPFLRRPTVALTTLNLRENQIGNTGVLHLADALQVNTVRRVLFRMLPYCILRRLSQRWILVGLDFLTKVPGT